MTVRRNILVTSALPYASGPLHLGHLVEYTQTDVWVRFQRMQGHDCTYVCASDAHGTPTMLQAEKLGIPPEKLVTNVATDHRTDFKNFGISVDKYQTTKNTDYLLKININQQIESLNISNSASIVFHYINNLKRRN